MSQAVFSFNCIADYKQTILKFARAIEIEFLKKTGKPERDLTVAGEISEIDLVEYSLVETLSNLIKLDSKIFEKREKDGYFVKNDEISKFLVSARIIASVLSL